MHSTKIIFYRKINKTERMHVNKEEIHTPFHIWLSKPISGIYPTIRFKLK